MQKSQGVIRLLSDLVSIDSRSSKNNKPIIDLLSKWFDTFEQYRQDWIREDGVKGQNLVVKIPGKSSDSCIVLVCHMDTVPPSDAWETDPFILEEQEGNLYGLGVCDTKGGVAAAIHAILTLKDKPASDIYFVFDGDEESYTTGAKKFRKTCKLKNPQFIFIEPTERNVMIAQRGVLSATIVAHGTAQHASLGTPEKNEKESAIYIMNKAINVLIDDGKDISKDDDSLLGSNSQNIGTIIGGTAGNVIPDRCEITIDRRLLPSRSPESEIKRIKNTLSLVDKRIEVKDVDTAPGFQTNMKSPNVNNIREIMKKFYPKTVFAPFIAWSEAGLFQELGDVIILGPGSLIGQAHKANEFIRAQDLFNFVHIYQEIMMSV